MAPESYVLLTTILLLFPMGYLFLACPAFLLVRLSIPSVPRLLRAMFKGYFIMLLVIGPLAMLAYAAAGRTWPAFGMGVIVAFAFFARRWFMGHFDSALQARDSDDANISAQAVRRLRLLHVTGMLVNGLQLAAVIAGIPYVV